MRAASLRPLFLLAVVVAIGVRADGPADGDGLAAFKAGRYAEALEAFRVEA